MASLIDLKEDIKEAIGWLRRAVENAAGADDPYREERNCPVMDALADRLQPILAQLEAVLPLDPEIEEGIEEEWDRICDYEDPRTMGLGR
jgi:hypothetical protein